MRLAASATILMGGQGEIARLFLKHHGDDPRRLAPVHQPDIAPISATVPLRGG